MQVQLSWEDPVTGEQWQPVFILPVALGRKLDQMPTTFEGQQVARTVLNSKQISRFHALIAIVNGQLVITDKSVNGIYVKDRWIRQSSEPLASGDTLKIGPYSITFTLLPETESESTEAVSPSSTIFDPESSIAEAQAVRATPNKSPDSGMFFHPESDLLDYRSAITQEKNPPLPNIFGAERVSIEEIKRTVLQSHYEEKDYAAIGGGMGSFAWVDAIRIWGVKAEQIRVIGRGEHQPYSRYRLICRNSQIPEYERIRSGSDSCPDNIWGWPGYAIREAWRNLFSGNLIPAFKYLWQVFAEPVLADTYSPRSGDVFASMDRESDRIGWKAMWRSGNILAIRKTDDGRYVIVYSPTEARVHEYQVLVARYVHLCIGYPTVKFLPDLLEYRETTGDCQSVVNAYENHESVYKQLKKQGGTVIVRGRGIVASRIIQRLNEIRQQNDQITIIHLMRSPNPKGGKFGSAQRYVENHWEFQPYNWPKGTWGGDMRKMLEAANPPGRYQLLEDWAGTTTADRHDWRRIIDQGLKEGWYRITFGKVEQVERNQQGQPVTWISSSSAKSQIKTNIEADFIIDATGLESNPDGSPLLKDLIGHYRLPLNPFGRLHVANDFEIKEMRNQDKRKNNRGRMYAAGIMTLGGPYAPVDTFLGLQYAAQRSAEGLVRAGAPKIKYLNGIGSFWQWIKWATNQEP